MLHCDCQSGAVGRLRKLNQSLALGVVQKEEAPKNVD